jgi:hypothetical protein
MQYNIDSMLRRNFCQTLEFVPKSSSNASEIMAIKLSKTFLRKT